MFSKLVTGKSFKLFHLSQNGFWLSWSDGSFGEKHKKNLTQNIFNIYFPSTIQLKWQNLRQSLALNWV